MRSSGSFRPKPLPPPIGNVRVLTNCDEALLVAVTGTAPERRAADARLAGVGLVAYARAESSVAATISRLRSLADQLETRGGKA